MKDRLQPNEYFISPYGENHEQVKALFNKVEDIILSHYGSSSERSPIPKYTHFDEGIYELFNEAQSIDQLLEDLKAVFAGSMNHISPNYIGHMDTMPTLMSLIGALSTAAINNNMLGIEMSPVFTRMESHILKTFSIEFGLGAKSGGIMGSGGSLLNLQAMAIARNNKLGLTDGDLTILEGKPIVIASEIAHASIEKSMMILGLGKSNLEKIKIDNAGKMSISHLLERLNYHVDKGNKPFCIVATLGSTTVGSIDPVNEIADICKKYNLWLHTDAIYGGAAVLSNKYKSILNGIEKSDSIAFNAQKWMLVAKTCSLLMFKNVKQALSDFKTDMPYTATSENEGYNLGEVSIQGSRTSEVLKLWLSLRHLGKSGYKQIIDRSFDLTFYFERHIDHRMYLEKYAVPETNTILFRIKNSESNETNTKLQKHLLNNHKLYFGLQQVLDDVWLKFMPLNPYSDEKVLDIAIAAIDDFNASLINSKTNL